ncbi:MAG: PHP domain-containing protein [Desulfobacterales bacterium]|nr:PHP domain-containing protein [Desulfobacterales bacterium]
MEYIDLHTHSSCSDGTMSPAAVVDWAATSGLKVMALTDHDTMAGVAAALARGRKKGIEVVPGVELSVRHGPTPIHLLGYWPQPDDIGLRQRLQGIQAARQERNQRIVARLNRLGIAVRMEELRQAAADGQIGRPHIARLLVAKGVVKDVNQAFAIYLRRGAAAYVERSRFEANEAIAVIQRAGGMAVLAHPGQLDPSPAVISGLLTALKDQGLAGVEAYYPSHSPKVTSLLKQMAKGLDLVVTGGSDFHGEDRRGALPGLTGPVFRVPYQLYEIMKEKRRISVGKEFQ